MGPSTAGGGWGPSFIFLNESWQPCWELISSACAHEQTAACRCAAACDGATVTVMSAHEGSCSAERAAAQSSAEQPHAEVTQLAAAPLEARSCCHTAPRWTHVVVSTLNKLTAVRQTGREPASTAANPRAPQKKMADCLKHLAGQEQLNVSCLQHSLTPQVSVSISPPSEDKPAC